MVSAGHALAAGKPISTLALTDPSNEIFHLCSTDQGKSFTCQQISPTDSKVASWLPSISRAGPFHPVHKPVILYTHGEPHPKEGEGCHSTVLTEVYAVFVE